MKLAVADASSHEMSDTRTAVIIVTDIGLLSTVETVIAGEVIAHTVNYTVPSLILVSVSYVRHFRKFNAVFPFRGEFRF